MWPFASIWKNMTFSRQSNAFFIASIQSGHLKIQLMTQLILAFQFCDCHECRISTAWSRCIFHGPSLTAWLKTRIFQRVAAKDDLAIDGWSINQRIMKIRTRELISDSFSSIGGADPINIWSDEEDNDLNRSSFESPTIRRSHSWACSANSSFIDLQYQTSILSMFDLVRIFSWSDSSKLPPCQRSSGKPVFGKLTKSWCLTSSIWILWVISVIYRVCHSSATKK